MGINTVISKLSKKPLKTLASIYLAQKWKRIQQDQLNPVAAQERALQKLKRNLAHTLNAKILETVSTLEDFAVKVPVKVHSDFETSIEKVCNQNAKGLLFNDELEFVGLSSGTIGGKCKRIPFNKKMVKVFTSFQTNFAAIVEHHSKVKFIADKRLTWGSSPITGVTETGIPCGYISGFLATRSPSLMKSTAFPSIQTSLIENMKEKILTAGAEIKNEDIRIISAVPTYLINLLQELKAEWGIENFSEVWPNLEAIGYSATSIEPYREQIQKLIGKPLKFFGAYASTEAPLGYEIPSMNGNRSGVYSFNFGEIVFMFRKIINQGSDNATQSLCSVADLKVGDEVEVLISSPNGFLQYAMGDGLRILSVKPTITFEVLGRIGQGLNVATEKVPMRQLQKAVTLTAEKNKIQIAHFFVHPGQAANGTACYEWTLIVDQPENLDAEVLGAFLDSTLMQLNADYEENRIQMGFLEKPIVHLMKTDVVKKYFAKESHRGQLKMKTAFDSADKFNTFLSELTG
ncbi:MAG: GH3 auxin-responsive promoter family protein [Deltaproteobacteria bacterium]|nr:GH3 auxin-responsive promoter family protein [Deltaproteobacteria bacterium]